MLPSLLNLPSPLLMRHMLAESTALTTAIGLEVESISSTALGSMLDDLGPISSRTVRLPASIWRPIRPSQCVLFASRLQMRGPSSPPSALSSRAPSPSSSTQSSMICGHLVAVSCCEAAVAAAGAAAR